MSTLIRRPIMRASTGMLTLLAGAILVRHGYLDGSVVRFYLGLVLGCAGLLVLSYASFPRRIPILATATYVAIVTTISLPAAEGLFRFRQLWHEENAPLIMSFERGRWEPDLLKRWQAQAYHAWLKVIARIARRVPDRVVPHEYIPNSAVRIFDSEYRINSLGFRGRQIELDKGDAYRIVAIGESTTFGVTVAPDDLPWPEVLEERIASGLECAKRIEVINAGRIAWNLSHTLARLERDVIPVAPDMVVSYHGINGFHSLMKERPPSELGDPPTVPARPSQLLARLEFELRVRRFNRWYREREAGMQPMSLEELFDTDYAKHYRELIGMAEQHDFVLVLCTFNMAVNDTSPSEVTDFYAQVFPDVRWYMKTSARHSRLVKSLAQTDGVFAIDTSAGLDGAYEGFFIDLIHFTQAGRDRLAENVLAGITPLLLAEERLSCRPRGRQP
jgi:lysophospholipase L1-like esterase